MSICSKGPIRSSSGNSQQSSIQWRSAAKGLIQSSLHNRSRKIQLELLLALCSEGRRFNATLGCYLLHMVRFGAAAIRRFDSEQHRFGVVAGGDSQSRVQQSGDCSGMTSIESSIRLFCERQFYNSISVRVHV